MHFRCLECCFLLPIKFTFPLVTLSMCVRATSVRSLFASFTCTPNSKEILWVLGLGLTWRAPSSDIKHIYALSSCSLYLIMVLTAFLFGQSRAQCGLSHRKHLILGINSFLSTILLPSRTLGILVDPILGALWSFETSSPLPMEWLSLKTQPWRSVLSCNSLNTLLLP